VNFAIRGWAVRGRSIPPPDSDLRVLSENSRQRAWSLTALATIALLITLIHRQTLAALAATVTSALSISDVEYGWLSTGMAAAFLVGSFPAARLTQRIGPQVVLALTVAATSLVIGLHSLVSSFLLLLALRVGMGFAVASSMPAAIQTIHRVLPFKDRARGIALLYLGNSLGSALCAPLAVAIESRLGWRWTFFGVALIGLSWIPIWVAISSLGRSSGTVNSLGPPPEPIPLGQRISLLELARHHGVLRGCLLVAAAAPVTLLMLIWAAKYLVHEYAVPQHLLGRYLWAPPLMFGAGSLLFGELRARSARNRASARPPRRLVALAAALGTTLAAVPSADGPVVGILLASVAMMGAGGLYTLATSDMLAHTPREAVPATSGLTTVTQSLVYITASPLIGKVVEHFGNYDWVMVGAGLWVLPCALFWLAEASARS
jgi:predicted MFS family arabinose efflux permease